MDRWARRDQVAAILHVLADASDGGAAVPWNVAADATTFTWLGSLPPTHVLPPPPPVPALWSWPAPPPPRPPRGMVLWDDDGLRRLASLDALHRHERVVREGWIFLCGWADSDDGPVAVCLPLLSRPVRLTWAADRFVLTPAGDLELTVAVPRGALADQLEADLPIAADAVGPWCDEVLAAMGFDRCDLLDPGLDPRDALTGDDRTTGPACTDGTDPGTGEPADDSPGADADGLFLSPGCGLFLDRSVAGFDLGPTLRTWAAVDGIEQTALAALYGLGPPVRPPRGPAPIWSPFPLTHHQHAILRSARTAPVTVVRGSPGTGKSHTVVATAVDAVDQRLSVLVATGSDHATEVLAELLNRRPGPTPVLFGNAELRGQLAAQLTSHVGLGESRDELLARAAGAQRAARGDAGIEGLITSLLQREQFATGWPGLDADLALGAAHAPGLLDPDTDLEALARLDEEVHAAGPRRSEREARRALAELRAGSRADPDLDPVDLHRVLTAARSRRTRAQLETDGGTCIGSLWDDLARSDDELALAVGALVSDKARLESTLAAGGRQAVTSLASVLRGERGERRRHLRTFDGRGLTRALPLWIGTLRDIDDLLPAVPALFDLVILDEAAQIDQTRAAPTLLRGRRVVVVGDPGQLTLDRDPDRPGIDLADALPATDSPVPPRHIDITRDSVFDLAAGDAPAIVLDEHFRSPPHLIGFSVEELGAPPMYLATRHPVNETRDDIETVLVDGWRDADGVNRAEVDAVREVVLELAAAGFTSIGVVTPFTEQAAALEQLLVELFPPQTARALGLRVGTVESLQGAERDVVVASFAVAPDDDPAVRAHLEDPHRFNVMITRARDRMIVVTSLRPGPRGLAERYLAYARSGMPPVPSVEPTDPWVRGLRDEFRRLGFPVRTGYPVGRWTVDLVVGDGDDAVAIECVPHPDGPAAHLERHRLLTRMGWQVRDAFPSRWEGDPVRAAVSLVTDLATETAR